MEKICFFISSLTMLCFLPTSAQVKETYKFSNDVDQSLAADTTDWKYQTAASLYAFSCDYQKALAAWDMEMPPAIYQPTARDSAVLAHYNAIDAKTYIIERSKNENVIIINEAHHIPMHRTFTTGLLEALYANGYRYLGLEALNDTLINDRGFATGTSGYYTAEPEFGNMIYMAKRIGFTLFGYEARGASTAREREIQQAENIDKFMKEHPTGKYLIHCGFDHVQEGASKYWEKAMAGRLKEITEIDPFTVDQVRFTEKSRPEFSHYLLKAPGRSLPFVLIGTEEQVFSGLQEPQQTDAAVLHPLTTYTSGRPDWIARGKIAYPIPLTKRSTYRYPLQVLAYRQNEFENKGIPADIIEVSSGDENISLFLNPGNYTIVVRDSTYTPLDIFDVHMGKSDPLTK